MVFLCLFDIPDFNQFGIGLYGVCIAAPPLSHVE